MMKIKRLIEPTQSNLLISDLKVGQIAQIISRGTYFGNYVLASYGNTVNLSNPKHNWNIHKGSIIEINVQLVPDNTILELEVHNGEC